MRGNGLTAGRYAVLADLPPSAADDALGRLASERVAAYADSSPARPGDDRLYVDVHAVTQARALLADLLDAGASGAAAADLDARFADIVATWQESGGEPVPRWPVSEDLDGGSAAGQTSGAPAGHVVRPAADAPGWDLPEPEPAAPEAADLDEGYQPPPPPPLPETDAGTRFAWAGVIGGPLLLMAAAVTGWQPPGWVLGLAVVGFVAGFVALVARIKDRPDDDPDGGAVV